MGKAQILMIVLVGMNLGLSLANHGKSKTGKHNFWTSVIAVGLEMWILIAGGFFG